MAETTLVSVMYHYVRPRDPVNWGGVHPLAPEEFAEQLDVLGAIGPIVPPSEAGRSGNPVEVVLTFDDGTRGQYEYAFREMHRRGVSGLFAVMSGPSKGHASLIHLVHVLTSKLSDAEILRGIDEFAGELSVDADHRDKLYWRETSAERRAVKYALNFAMPHEQALEVATQLYESRIGPVADLAAEWYLTDEMIREMHAGGMEFAVHCHRHLALYTPLEEYAASEIDPCAAWLTDLLGKAPTEYIAPFGGRTADGATVADLRPHLEARGFRNCHLVTRGVNPGYTPSTFFINRLDAADLPPRAPLPGELRA